MRTKPYLFDIAVDENHFAWLRFLGDPIWKQLVHDAFSALNRLAGRSRMIFRHALLQHRPR